MERGHASPNREDIEMKKSGHPIKESRIGFAGAP
jgi:hypothetical protein